MKSNPSPIRKPVMKTESTEGCEEAAASAKTGVRKDELPPPTGRNGQTIPTVHAPLGAGGQAKAQSGQRKAGVGERSS